MSLYRGQCGERSSSEEAGPRPWLPLLHFQRVSGGFWKHLEWILIIAGNWQMWLLAKTINGIRWFDQWDRNWISILNNFFFTKKRMKYFGYLCIHTFWIFYSDTFLNVFSVFNSIINTIKRCNYFPELTLNIILIDSKIQFELPFKDVCLWLTWSRGERRVPEPGLESGNSKFCAWRLKIKK